MNWTPGSSSGSQTLTVQDKLKVVHVNELREAIDLISLKIYYVNDFGAVGDNTTDDYAAIMAAVDQCCADGGKGIIEFGVGTYIVSDTVFYRGTTPASTFNIVFRGAGRGLTRLKLKDNVAIGTGPHHIRTVLGGSYNGIETPLTPYTQLTTNTFDIYNMTIDYNGQNQSVNSVVTCLILENRGQNSIIDGCGFVNAIVPTFNLAAPSFGIGLNNYDSRFARVTNCYFSTCDEGMWQTTYGQGDPLDMYAAGNYFYNMTDSGIYYESGIGNVLIGNEIDTALYGINAIAIDTAYDAKAVIAGNPMRNISGIPLRLKSPYTGISSFGNPGATTGFMGFGTGSPEAQVHIASNVNTLQLRFGSGSNSWEINRDNITTGRLRFMQNSGSDIGEPLSILKTGQIGIGGVTNPTATLHLEGATTGRASLRINSGTAPTSPNDGDIWFDGTNLKIRIAGVTKTFTVT